MKKIIAMIAAMGLFLTGCDLNETTLIATANTAGNLTMLTWFSIDNPDPEVKTVLKEVVTKVTAASVKIGEGETYLETVLPEIQEIALKQEKLNDYQKTLINAGAVVILNGVDTFIAANDKVKTNTDLASKVVAAFGKGCLTVLNMAEDAPEIQRARGVYTSRSLKCRGGKFISTPRSSTGKCNCGCIGECDCSK